MGCVNHQHTLGQLKAKQGRVKAGFSQGQPNRFIKVSTLELYGRDIN
jgi:hypothetical protein